MAVDSNAMAAVNTTLTGLNTLLLVGLLVRGGAPTAPTPVAAASVDAAGPSVRTTVETPPSAPVQTTAVEPATPPTTPNAATGSSAEPAAPATGASPLANFLDSTLTPLKSAAADLKRPVVLPTAAEEAACEQSGDLTSAPCGVVIALLKKGYGITGMPFPSLPEANAPSGTSAPSQATSGAPSHTNGALRVYFDTLTKKIRKSAVDVGDDPTTLLPSAEAVDAAVASGAIDSAASQAVLDQLRKAHLKYGLKFTEPLSPPGGAARTPPPAAPQAP